MTECRALIEDMVSKCNLTVDVDGRTDFCVDDARVKSIFKNLSV